ncbi:MAG TPA: hypothetical protein DCZ13_05910 [Porticoccaceae bacterium]|nr:hypothetical protein [Porticoccaceae bacterium]
MPLRENLGDGGVSSYARFRPGADPIKSGFKQLFSVEFFRRPPSLPIPPRKLAGWEEKRVKGSNSGVMDDWIFSVWVIPIPVLLVTNLAW